LLPPLVIVLKLHDSRIEFEVVTREESREEMLVEQKLLELTYELLLIDDAIDESLK